MDKIKLINAYKFESNTFPFITHISYRNSRLGYGIDKEENFLLLSFDYQHNLKSVLSVSKDFKAIQLEFFRLKEERNK